MTSYQRLKAKNQALKKEIEKLLSDPEYYMSQAIAHNVAKGITRSAMFGEHKPSGKIKMSGLLKKLILNK